MTRLFSREQLQHDGFVGFCRWNDRDNQTPRDAPGVYVVLREAATPPQLLTASPAGRYKRRDPTVATATLHDAWVPGCPGLYIGKATSLRTRLHQHHDHGRGQPVGHWGGRYIWQLEDSADLLVCWRVTYPASPAHVEAEMLGGVSRSIRPPPLRQPQATKRHSTCSPRTHPLENTLKRQVPTSSQLPILTAPESPLRAVQRAGERAEMSGTNAKPAADPDRSAVP